MFVVVSGLDLFSYTRRKASNWALSSSFTEGLLLTMGKNSVSRGANKALIVRCISSFKVNVSNNV